MTPAPSTSAGDSAVFRHYWAALRPLLDKVFNDDDDDNDAATLSAQEYMRAYKLVADTSCSALSRPPNRIAAQPAAAAAVPSLARHEDEDEDGDGDGVEDEDQDEDEDGSLQPIAEMHRALACFVRERLDSVGAAVAAAAAAGAGEEEEDVVAARLDVYDESWAKFEKQARTCSRLFAYMDRHYVLRARDTTSRPVDPSPMLLKRAWRDRVLRRELVLPDDEDDDDDEAGGGRGVHRRRTVEDALRAGAGGLGPRGGQRRDGLLDHLDTVNRELDKHDAITRNLVESRRKKGTVT